MKTKDTETLAAVALLAGLAWYLYTRSKGLTLTGTYANPMLPAPRAGSQMSTVTPSGSVSQLATNVFSAIGQSLQGIVSKLSKPGNATPIGASSTISRANVASWGLQVPAGEPAPPVADAVPAFDDSLNASTPFWSMPGVALGTAPYMPWTLNPSILGFDPNYIAPPPGA